MQNWMENDREVLARTLMAEAGNQGPTGMLAAGSVIMNRARTPGYGDGVRGVILKPGQFSPWNSVTGYAGGEQGQNMAAIQPTQDAYAIADTLLSGQYQDPTGGATHFYNPDISDPAWGQRSGGNWTQIGSHIFGQADAPRSGAGGSTMQPQSMSTQGAMPEQEKTPFYQNPDFWDRLALGFGGMTLNPNQALLSSVSDRISQRAEERASTQQANRTAEWLRSQNRPDLAEAVLSGSIDGTTAASIAYKEPKEQYNTITGEQLNAQRGTSFAPGDLFNVSPSGQITKVGGGGPQTNVTVMPGGDKMADTFGAAVPGILEVGGQARRSLIELDELERLLATTPQGVTGGLVQLASNFGFDVSGADDLQAAQAIINRLVPQQRAPGSGPMSDADLELFKQSLPRIINQPGGNQLIINTIRKIVEYDMKRADIVARGLQAGAEKSPTQIMLEVYQLGNPLADVKSSFGGASPEGGTAAPKVRTYNPDTQRLE